MAHTLTERERSNMWEAFTNWDSSGEGTIRASDMCKVLELLGEKPSSELRMLSERPDAVNELIDFEEFLIMTVGPPWGASGHDYVEELSEAFAALDDGSGYVPLRDLMGVLHGHMEERGHHVTDAELIDIYRHALDVSFFDRAAGSGAPEAMWKFFEEEFTDLRGGRRTEEAASVASGLRFRAGDGESANEAPHMLNFAVVDLSGKHLMSDAAASTWSVLELQQHIESVLGLPIHRQALCLGQEDGFRHGLFPKSASLSKVGVSDGSTLLLVMKDEVKLDYNRFIAKLFDGELDTSTS